MGLSGHTHTVYVVDGDADHRCSLVEQLRAAGMTVLAFDSAESFLASNMHPRTACLILDLNLPGMNGLALQAHLNQRHVPLPVIFMASAADIASAVTAIQNGAVDFVQKSHGNTPIIAAANRLVAAIQTGPPATSWRHPYAPATDGWGDLLHDSSCNLTASRNQLKHVE